MKAATPHPDHITFLDMIDNKEDDNIRYAKCSDKDSALAREHDDAKTNVDSV
jgi:hypothetical protein